MSNPDPPAAPARPAATILLLRESRAGMEVFMVVRHQQIDFASGALVFPGGKLATGDNDSRLQTLCAGAGALSADSLALRVAAIREAFEECGVLLARGQDGASIAPERLAELSMRYRLPLERGEIGIAEVLVEEKLTLTVDALVPFAHWITPTFMPKRFDTHFFLAAAPDDQLAVHDGTENVDSAWLRPAEAIAAAEAGQRTMVPATLINLRKLAGSTTVAGALAAAAAAPVVTVLPERIGSTNRLRIPAEAGYGATEFSFP